MVKDNGSRFDPKYGKHTHWTVTTICVHEQGTFRDSSPKTRCFCHHLLAILSLNKSAWLSSMEHKRKCSEEHVMLKMLSSYKMIHDPNNPKKWILSLYQDLSNQVRSVTTSAIGYCIYIHIHNTTSLKNDLKAFLFCSTVRITIHLQCMERAVWTFFKSSPIVFLGTKKSYD